MCLRERFDARPARSGLHGRAVPDGVGATAAAARGLDYAELSRQVKQAGLLERRRWSYTWRIAVVVALLVARWGAFVLVGDSWWQLAVAVFLGVMFTSSGSSATTPGTGRSPVPGGQPHPRRAARQSGHRAQLWMVGRQAQPPSRPPQHRGKRIRTSGCAYWRSPNTGARQPGLVPCGVPLPGVPVLPDAARRGAQRARRGRSARWPARIPVPGQRRRSCWASTSLAISPRCSWCSHR